MSDALETTQSNMVPVPWMQDRETRDYQSVLGAEKDRLLDRCNVGVKMRWPGGPSMQAAQAGLGLVNAPVPSAVGDAKRLQLMGAGYNLPRLGGMSDEQYEAYLEIAWKVWGLGGTPQSITDALNRYGIVDVEIVEEWQDPWGPWANPRGGPYGHRCSIILGPDYGTLGWAPQTLPFTLDTDGVLGISGMTFAQLQDIARLIRLWKDAGALPIKLVFRFTVDGVTTPVLGLEGLTLPFWLESPEGVEGMLTEHFFGEVLDSCGRDEGIYLPFNDGPTYIYGP